MRNPRKIDAALIYIVILFLSYQPVLWLVIYTVGENRKNYVTVLYKILVLYIAKSRTSLVIY